MGLNHRAFRRPAAIALALLAGGCGRSQPQPPPMPADRLANVIDTVSVAKPEAEPEPQVHRLGTLEEAEVPATLGAAPFCRLDRGGRLLLVAHGGRALARVDRRLVSLVFGGAVDTGGGFFTAPGVSISVGRPAPVAREAEAPGMAWPVGITVGGAAKLPLEKLDGTWTCRF
jgi:hypothetical protein